MACCWRPARFLDWAHAAGLLRLSGIGIRFRHRELQTWLTDRTDQKPPLGKTGDAT